MRTSTRFRNLPRDARDTLVLLVVVAWTLLPHAWHLPLWCIGLTTGLLLWRAWLAWTSRPLPHTIVRTAMLALAVGLTWWSFGSVIGKDPGVTLLVMLVVIKTLELRARRDALVIFFLGFFLIITNFFYSQSLLVALAMLLAVWGLLTALVLANIQAGRPSLREAGGIAASMAAWSLPVMVVLFFVFPRLGPLWGGDQGQRASTGLSNTLRMGAIAELVQNDQIAFRVKFDGPAPPPASLYFRGPVLTVFDGREWQRARTGDMPPAHALRVGGTRFEYEMALEPSNAPVLPMLEWTSHVEGHAATNLEPALRDAMPLGTIASRLNDAPRLRHDGQWTTDRPVTERLQFRALAHAQATLGPTRVDASLAEHLTLPGGANPRTAAWALQLLEAEPLLKQQGVEGIVQRLLTHIREGYSYTTAPGVYGDARGRGAVDEFWLDRREGFCEHFATAMVVVLRNMGIPSRVVTGYQGADPTLQDGWHVVRQLNAHAWVEVWQPNQGWRRVDPTAAVAPERIQQGQTMRPAPGLMGSMLGSIDPALWPRLQGVWETTQLRWNQWIVQYSRGQQFDLLKTLGVAQPDWSHLVYSVIILLTSASLGGALWAWWERRRRDPWERLQSEMRERLHRVGIEALPHESPRTLATRVRLAWGDGAAPVVDLLMQLERTRYARGATARPDPVWWKRFVRATLRAPP